MKNQIVTSLAIVGLGGMMFVGSARAQAGPGVVDPGHPRVNQVNRREARQQRRIAHGVRNGALTPHQAAHLEHREAQLHRQERRDMARHNGHLTPVEQRKLNRKENRISRSINRDETRPR
jgi:hypothetical protein